MEKLIKIEKDLQEIKEALEIKSLREDIIVNILLENRKEELYNIDSFIRQKVGRDLAAEIPAIVRGGGDG